MPYKFDIDEAYGRYLETNRIQEGSMTLGEQIVIKRAFVAGVSHMFSHLIYRPMEETQKEVTEDVEHIVKHLKEFWDNEKIEVNVPNDGSVN